MLTRFSRRPSLGTVLGATALFVALGGPAQAAHLVVGSGNLRNGAVTSSKLRANAVTGAKVRNRSLGLSDLSTAAIRGLQSTPANSVGSAQIADNSITSLDIAPGKINGDRIAGNAIDSDRILDNSIRNVDIGPNAVEGDEVTNESLTGSDIKDNSLDSSEIQDGTLKAADIGRFGGELSLSFGAIDAGKCQTVSSTSLTAISTVTQDLSDDAIVMTPPRGWPDNVLVTAFPGSADNLIEVTVCNLGTGQLAAQNDTKFHYVTVDTVGN